MRSPHFSREMKSLGEDEEEDTPGELDVPKDVYLGISTRRAIYSFQISGRRFPWNFMLTLLNVKKAWETGGSFY